MRMGLGALTASSFVLSLGGAVAQAIPGGAQLADLTALDPATAVGSEDGKWLYYDIRALGIEGQGWTDLAHPYDRLPAKAEGVVRDPVWGLSHNSAGMCVRFVTDARSIAARWKLRSASLDMDHMPATGVSGLDLYGRGDDGWHWVGTGRPGGVDNEEVLVEGLDEGPREFILYLPLYNGVESVSVGVPPGTTLAKAPAYPNDHAKPICFYGTSITQGGCASRTGMAYAAIIGRWLDRPAINLGFSGNGQMEPEMARLLAELDVSCYVIDCCPNLGPELVAERTEPLVRTIREARPEVPIVLVENIIYQQAPLVAWARDAGAAKNVELKAAYDRLIADGVAGLHYVEGADLLGGDGLGTVDGTHPTDLGFLRMAEVLTPVLARVLNGE